MFYYFIIAVLPAMQISKCAVNSKVVSVVIRPETNCSCDYNRRTFWCTCYSMNRVSECYLSYLDSGRKTLDTDTGFIWLNKTETKFWQAHQ